MSTGNLEHLLLRDRSSRQESGERRRTFFGELLDESEWYSRLLMNIEGDALGHCCEGELKCSVLF